MTPSESMVHLEAGGRSEMVPPKPLNIILGSLGLTQQAARFGVERYNGSSWEPFPTHRTPLPGDRLRIHVPPDKPRPHLQRLMGRLTQLIGKKGRSR